MTEFGPQHTDAKKYKGHSFETRISKCVTNIVRHHDQDEREADGAIHWNIILPVLRGRFQNQLEKDFTDEDWLHCPYLGSFKTRFEICKDENEENYIYIYIYIYIHVYLYLNSCNPGTFRWNDHCTKTDKLRNDSLQMETIHLPRGSSRARDQYSIAETGLVAGGQERKEGRQTIFFTPFDPFNSDTDEADLITDIMKPRKIHYQMPWRPEQDAVY